VNDLFTYLDLGLGKLVFKIIIIIINLMFYELFLNYIRDLCIKDNTITWEEIKDSPMWLYMISYFSEHIL
jgi:hypothetical protein